MLNKKITAIALLMLEIDFMVSILMSLISFLLILVYGAKGEFLHQLISATAMFCFLELGLISYHLGVKFVQYLDEKEELIKED